MRLSLLLINAGLVAVTMMLAGHVAANWQYDSVYGGLTQYATPQSQPVTVTRNGIGRHPTRLDYNEGSVTYDYQDNVAGQRAMRTRTATGQNPTVSHFVFGGLNPMVEFADTEVVHYTVGDMYVTVDTTNTVQVQYAVTDRMLSTRAILFAPDTTVSAQFGYDTLGKPTENDQACTATDCRPAHRYPYRFQGHQYLAWDDAPSGYQPGITDNKDRFYSHDQGLRFMNTDAAGASISPYVAYADDPVNFGDLNGLMYTWNELLRRLKGAKWIWIADTHDQAGYIELVIDLLSDGLEVNKLFMESIMDQIKNRKQSQTHEKMRKTFEECGSNPISQKQESVSLWGVKTTVTTPFRTSQKDLVEAAALTRLKFYNDMVSFRDPKFNDPTQPVSMNLEQIDTVKSQLRRLAAERRLAIKTTVEANISWILFGGKGYSTYASRISEESKLKGGSRLVLTGSKHVFHDQLDPESTQSADRRFPNDLVSQLDYGNSLGMLRRYGGYALIMKYVGDPNDRPIGWENKDTNTSNGLYRFGTYETGIKGFVVDVYGRTRIPRDKNPNQKPFWEKENNNTNNRSRYQGEGNNNRDTYGNYREP
jgi:hypothetical protein